MARKAEKSKRKSAGTSYKQSKKKAELRRKIQELKARSGDIGQDINLDHIPKKKKVK